MKSPPEKTGTVGFSRKRGAPAILGVQKHVSQKGALIAMNLDADAAKGPRPYSSLFYGYEFRSMLIVCERVTNAP